MMNSSNIFLSLFFILRIKNHTNKQELLSNLVYGRRESSGLPARFSFVHPIDEPHVGEHVGQLTEAA